MQVPKDFICEHGMPQPWATCTDCMLLPFDLKPQPPRPPPEPEPVKAKRPSRAKPKTSAAATKTKAAPKARAKAKPKARAPKLPKTIDDEMPPLTGTKDLSYEIPAINLRHHVQGADKDWLPISTLPKELRADGFVYLQTDREVVARCPVKGIGFRERRWTHENAEQTSDAGPGATLELDGDRWEFMTSDLGAEGAAPISGYRYLITDGPNVRASIE